MSDVYKKLDETLVNPVTHSREILFKHPEALIYVGTDSQTHRRKTVYAVVIAYRYGTRGVHYIYQKRVVPKIKDLWDRLLKETELSIECANMLRDGKIPIEAIDLDFNSDDKWESHRLVSASVGWVQGSGFKARVKIDESIVKDDEILIATKAADHQVRHLTSKEERKANRRLKKKKKKKS